MGSSTYKGNGILAKELEDKLMKFTNKDEDHNMDAASIELTEEIQRQTAVEINITECTKPLHSKLFEGEYQDTTESSSSFGGSDCGIENTDSVGDSEALSDFRDDASSALKFGGFGEKLLMRKKLTTHWRSFIKPLMWRCKWIELQIKKLQSQAQQYDRELETQKKRKEETNLENCTLDNCVKSLPFSRTNARSDVLKRKKRRLTEATTDVTAYMSHHNLFSYYENKKRLNECAIMSMPKNPAADECNTAVGICSNDDTLSVQPGPGNCSLEQLLWKIHSLQSQVGKIKGRVDGIMAKGADKLSSTDIFSLPTPCNTSNANSGGRMPVGTYIASRLISEYKMGDARIADSAVTSRGDVPDVSRRIAHGCFVNAYENVEDGVLIDNQRVKEELNSFEEMRITPVEKPLVLNEGLGNAVKEEISNSEEAKIHPIQIPLAVKDGLDNSTPFILPDPEVPTDDQPPTKIRSLANLTAPGSKKKAGRRKGPGRWSRRPKG